MFNLITDLLRDAGIMRPATRQDHQVPDEPVEVEPTPAEQVGVSKATTVVAPAPRRVTTPNKPEYSVDMIDGNLAVSYSHSKISMNAKTGEVDTDIKVTVANHDPLAVVPTDLDESCFFTPCADLRAPLTLTGKITIGRKPEDSTLYFRQNNLVIALDGPAKTGSVRNLDIH